MSGRGEGQKIFFAFGGIKGYIKFLTPVKICTTL